MNNNTVWFRCNRKHDKIFVLNARKQVTFLPNVGDILTFSNEDFHKATFRVKAYSKTKYKNIRHLVTLKFVVTHRNYEVKDDIWELICEPTMESIEYCLTSLKV